MIDKDFELRCEFVIDKVNILKEDYPDWELEIISTDDKFLTIKIID